ncbi:uncharacterized protein LOC128213634 [Mya arenaria]|uniref:uncharacterized protein LOC128213634 n=1 Tax=Mya arenaria TaxID=6604 RepID=UPI0022E155DA|nr:uncharacterized protein LOC128213634 [Mya arenaria]XP_052775578.1 uncharacterized protein LOC128213634 [Mya arenaria]
MLHQVLTGRVTFTSLTPPDLSICSKSELRAYFENSYDLNESLFTSLKDESVFYRCPDRLRLPLIFYFAHTAVVYVNKLILAGLLKDRINFEFEKMFETGVDEMSWDDTENYRMGGLYKWPELSATVEYRRQVRATVLRIIEETPLQLPITMTSPWWALLMGMEHERIHLETSSVLIRQLPVAMVSRPEGWKYAPKTSGIVPQQNRMLRVPAQEVSFGKPRDFPSYGWDNEYGSIACSVPAFESSEFLVTNAEYFEFVEAGGYHRSELWTEEGWRWRNFRQANHPMFWVCGNGCKGGCGSDLASYSHCSVMADSNVTPSAESQYRYRAMFDVLDMPWAWPVDVNYHEARAFCAWKGPDFRLLVEAEHNVIRGKQEPTNAGTVSDAIFTKGDKFNHNMKFGSSTPVNMHVANERGFYDVFGNVWQWCEDQFNGLCDETHWLYDDFSSPCYDGKHNVILGGSWISTGDEASRFARLAFRRHFLQHAGFRLARTVDPGEEAWTELPTRHVDTQVYVLGCGVEENLASLPHDKLQPNLVPSTNLHYHFETPLALKGILEQEFGFRKSYPVAVADLCADLARNNGLHTRSMLWIGAGSGRGPMLMSKIFQKVLACDLVARFLDTAMYIQRGNDVTVITENGKVTTAALDKGVKTDRVVFKQFTWIPNEVGLDFDMTVVTFLERTQQPKAWLLRLSEITRRGGLVIVASRSGQWDRPALEGTLQDKGLTCIESTDVPFDDVTGNATATVTVWKHVQE